MKILTYSRIPKQFREYDQIRRRQRQTGPGGSDAEQSDPKIGIGLEYVT